MVHRKVDRCGVTRKVRFKSEEHALNFALNNPPLSGIKFRVYECEFCAGWHITTQPRRAR